MTVDAGPAPAARPLPAAPAREQAPAPAPADGWALFEGAVREHHRALRGFAARVLRDPDRTDDVLQEAYLRAFRTFADFDGGATALRSWLFRIVYSCCVDDFRRKRRGARLAAAVSATAASSVETGADERLSLRQALDALTPDVRAAVVLVHWCGLDYDSAASVLGVPAGTVGSRLTTGRRILRAKLRPEGPGRGGGVAPH